MVTLHPNRVPAIVGEAYPGHVGQAVVVQTYTVCRGWEPCAPPLTLTVKCAERLHRDGVIACSVRVLAASGIHVTADFNIDELARRRVPA